MNTKRWIPVVAILALSPIAVKASTTSCSSVSACLFGSNSSSGIGVEGSSKSGFGLSGVSSSGHGVNGTSSSSFGVVGVTTENATSVASARAGVLGQDSSTNKKAFNSGVAGSSAYGYGGSFTSTNGTGLYASSADIAGNVSTGTITAVGDTYGIMGIPDGGMTGVGDFGVAGVIAYGNGSIIGGADDIFIGVGCHTDPDVPVGCGDEATIDSYGNAVFGGSVTEDGDVLARTRSSIGSDVASFGARTAAPSLEDVGKGQLRNGVAYIALDRTFASTIDPHTAYSVFITPEGDSNGLYTSALSPTGFAVHENRSGRSSLVFDYRIIAKPLTAKAMHLPSMSAFPQLRKHEPNPRDIMKRAQR